MFDKILENGGSKGSLSEATTIFMSELVNYKRSRQLLDQHIANCKSRSKKGDEGFDCFLGITLGKGMAAILDFVDSNDRGAVVRGEPLEDIDSVVNANRFFVKFFLGAMQKYQLGLEDLDNLYNAVFNDSFRKWLSQMSMDSFDRGVAAAIKAGFYLKSICPEGKVIVSSLIQDRDHGVDFIVKKASGQEILVAIESAPIAKCPKPKLYVLSQPEDMEKFSRYTRDCPPGIEKNRIGSMNKIREYSQAQKNDAWWVDIPME